MLLKTGLQRPQGLPRSGRSTETRAPFTSIRSLGNTGLSTHGAAAQAAIGCNGSGMAMLGGVSACPSMSRARQHGPAQRSRVRAQATMPAPVDASQAYKYRFFTKMGNLMKATVEYQGPTALVDISLDSESPDAGGSTPLLHWGMYRGSAGQWYHPKEVVPQGSTLDQSSGGMRSPMVWVDARQEWCTSFTISSKLLPLHLAVVFLFQDKGVYDVPHRTRFFSIPVGMSAGEPAPQGATVVSVAPPGARPEEATCMVNFGIFSRHATAMYLCLVRVQPNAQQGVTALQGTGILEIALDPVTNRTGDMWHVCVHGLKNIGLMCYGWRADGDMTWENGGRFHPGYILADPYATRVVPVLLPEAAYTSAPKLLPSYDLKQPVLLGSLAAFTQTFTWDGAHVPMRPDGRHGRRPLEGSLVLELDVATFTTGPDAEKMVPPERRGRYLGVLDRLAEIVKLGVTTVLLAPTTMCGAGIGPWSRNPTTLFAPDTKYALNGPLSAAAELKMMIQALHRAGLEVLLGVEFCITAEGSDAMSGGLQGMRGLDAAVYYRTLPDRTSVLAAGHPVVRKTIVDAVRHWATEYSVDGFVFANAENLTQDRFGSVLDNPTLAEELAQDASLRHLKLVAAPANYGLLPRGGVRGFPHWGSWAQIDDRFGMDLWSYLVDGTPGILSKVATRITGSADLFAPQWDAVPPHPGGLAAGRRAAFGYNTFTGLGDSSLLKLLGSDTNLERAEVLARTLLLAQCISPESPIVSAATVARKGLWRFVSVLAALRREYADLLCPPVSFGLIPDPTEREIRWHGAAPGAEVDWQNVSGGQVPTNALALSIRGATPGRAIFCVLNPYNEPVTMALPGADMGGTWRVVVDTARLPPEDADLEGPVLPWGQPVVEVGPKAGLLLVSVSGGEAPSRAAPASSGARAASSPQQFAPGSRPPNAANFQRPL